MTRPEFLQDPLDDAEWDLLRALIEDRVQPHSRFHAGLLLSGSYIEWNRNKSYVATAKGQEALEFFRHDRQTRSS